LLSKSLDDVPPSVLKIIDTVELFFRNPERFEIAGLKAPFVCTPESEKSALARADALVAIQRNDAEALRTLFPEKQVIIVSHAYRQVGRAVSRFRPGTVLYVGSPNPFNVHGLRLFVERAWETILRRVPGARLRVVGSIPLVPEMDMRQITHVGRVTDDQLLREYQMAHAVINPQMAGTGLKIKCVEALSSGCPLVVNQAGADGLEHGIGTAFLVATDWKDFADHVVTILTDDVVRRQLEIGAREFAEKFFSPDATFSELAPLLAGRRTAS
jgi:glycosyltransferase involved in cell wall biosynthesis